MAEPAGGRHLRIDAVLLSDAELEHTVGLLSLRDAYSLALFLGPGPLAVLARGSHILPTLRAFTDVTVTELPPGQSVPLRGRGGASGAVLTVESIPLGPSPSRLGTEASGAVTALIIADSQSGGRVAIVPRCPALDAVLLERLATVDAIFFDGTFWSDDALIDLGFTSRTARELGHLPITGPDGSLRELAALPAKHRVYVHLDNTNPVLIEGSRERLAVESAGMQVGTDGMRFIV